MKAKKTAVKKIKAPWWAPRDFVKDPIHWGKE